MKASRWVAAVATGIFLYASTAIAQQQFNLAFRGICRTTNDSGRFITRVLTDREIIRQCAMDNGLGKTNLKQMALVYQKNADYNGDLIQVINATNGNVICTPFRVLFQRSIPNDDGRRVERLAFLYNPIRTDSVGSAVLTEQAYLNSDGSLRRIVITGRMQFFDEVYNSNRFAVCTGTFIARTPLNPH
jgi:hypothetical protein